MEMGYREYARHRGVTLGAVQKAIRDQRIKVNENRKIDSEQADRDWAANTDAARVAVNVLTPGLAAQQSLALPQQSMASAAVDRHVDDEAKGEDQKSDALSGNDRSASEYREHRATRERYQALTQQLEYEQLIGKLINVEEAKRIAYTTFRSLRDAVLNVSPRVKDQLAALTDPHEVEQVLDRELAAALGSIDPAKLLTEQDQDE